MFNWFLRLFGFGKKDETTNVNVTEKTRASSVTPTRKNVDRTKYYRKNGNFYAYEDDSLVEDLLMVAILVEMFDEPDYIPQDDGLTEEASIDDDAAAIDAAVEQIREETAAPEVVYSDPTPVRVPDPTPDYSSSSSSDYGSSDSSSSYDSGSSGGFD